MAWIEAEEGPKRRRAKPVPAVEPDAPVELLVPVEALERPAPIYEAEPPAVAPRIRTTLPPHRRIPKSARLVPMTLDDPDAAPAPAQVVKPPAGSTANGHGPKEWQAPARPVVHVVTSTRGDCLNYMRARFQIDSASYAAGRRYQALYEQAELAGLPSVDISACRGSSSARSAATWFASMRGDGRRTGCIKSRARSSPNSG